MKSSSTKKIWVNPVQRISVQGRHKQVYTIVTGEEVLPTQTMNKTKEEGVPSFYHFPIDNERRKIISPLQNIEVNPFYNMDISDIVSMYGLSTDWNNHLESVVKQRQILKQTLFEIKHGVAPGFYTHDVKYLMTNLPKDPAEYQQARVFLQDLTLILYPRPNMFDNSTPRQELLMEMIQVLPQIAKNKNEANVSLHDWYISEEFEEESEKARKQEMIEEAIYNLYKLKQEYGVDRTYQVAVILRDKDSRTLIVGEASPEKVNNVLSNFINTKDNYQLRNVDEFMNVVSLLKTVEGIERFDVTYLVQQALNTNVISHRDQEYVWHSKSGTPDVYKLGTSFDKMVSFFLKEYATYNPDSEVTNWYGDLLKEVKSKGIRVTDV